MAGPYWKLRPLRAGALHTHRVVFIPALTPVSHPSFVTLRALRVQRERFSGLSPSAHFCVQQAITPTHPHHTVNRSTRSFVQDVIVLLRDHQRGTLFTIPSPLRCRGPITPGDRNGSSISSYNAPAGMAKRKKAASKTPLLDSLSAGQAQSVLMRLVCDDPSLAARAEGIARDLLKVIDSVEIAGILCDDLSALEIEEVWKTSGRTREGYIYPSERAWGMMDEVIESYKEEMMTYLRRGMPEESRIYCSGILLGLREFQRDSRSDLLEEAPDYCDDTFESIREEWEEAVDDAGQVHLLARFIEEEGLNRGHPPESCRTGEKEQ